VRGDAGCADRTVVEAVEMVGRADGRTVVAPVVAATGAKADVVVVEIATRAAGRHRAAPTVAGEDRIVVTRRALPMSDDVAQEAFEGGPARLFWICKRTEHVPQQRHDGCRPGESDLGVRDLERFLSLCYERRRGALLVRTDLQSRVR